ncbi:SusC/RagA family TonB-linked outer membrane protein [Gillisia marina]|uniref:SusC/RagA family TonB-linked outer membrane protein n=1 Tax=Gillisia marina TaxID=1167637 RepID=UPI00029A2D9B|nr:TonB-dependent receptor [Gillisia marina]
MEKRLNGILTLLLAFVVQFTFAQDKTVTGTVTDDAGLPLPGVNIVVKGTNSGTQTDFDGNYSISAQAQNTLVFSFIGFAKQEIVVGTQSLINVSLGADAAALDEVIVVGYGSTRRELSTSAISTVTAEDIEDFVPSTSVDNILQGQAAGVQVTAANGRPGNTAFVQIRGVGSINASTTPLYIVDGTPIDASDVANINPGDIASFSILKDAATVSKYGSRGANGVVLITTKQGKPGDAKITFRSSLGYGEKIDDPFDLMNAEQKLELERQYAALGVNAAQSLPGATASPEELQRLIALDTNWEEELLRKSYIQSNALSISGAEDKLSYFLSLGYDKNDGIIDRIDGFERISGRLNTTYQAKDWLTVGMNVSMARSTTDLPRDRNNVQNPFRGVYDYNPYEPLFLRDADNNIVVDAEGNNVFNPTSTGFPIARALTTEPENNRNFLIIGSGFADIKLTDKFSNRFSVGATSNRFNRTNRSVAGGLLQSFVGDANFPGTQTDTFSLDFEYNVNNIFSYSDTFNELHNFRADFLLEYNENIFTNLTSTSRGFPSPDIPYQAVAAEATAASSTEARRILFSQGLFLDYNYDEKYILSGSIRRDGSSRFGPNNKYGYFYSGSAAWNIARENFLEDSFVNDLKLRASYGTSGNQNIGNFEFLNLLGFGTYNGFTTAIPLGVGNPDIKWEAQAILDVGVEFALFNNRVSGVVDYFKKTSDDLLLDRPISQTVGDENNAITANIGKIENTGVEVSLKGDVVRNSNFIWTIGGNASFLDNEVLELVDGADIPNGTTRLVEGQDVYSYYLVRYAGVNPANGEPLYLDVDGNVTNEYSTADAVLIEGKSPFADVEGGFYTSFRYKGFGLRSDFIFKSGNYILNFQRSSGISALNIDSNQRVEAFDYWMQPGDTDVLPSPLFGDTADQTSTRFLEKGDYIRLRTLTLDYRVPSEMINSFGINSLRIFATGQNLLTFTDYEGDPEIGIGSAENAQPGDQGFVPGEFSLFSYPQTKSYTVGVELSF